MLEVSPVLPGVACRQLIVRRREIPSDLTEVSSSSGYFAFLHENKCGTYVPRGVAYHARLGPACFARVRRTYQQFLGTHLGDPSQAVTNPLLLIPPSGDGDGNPNNRLCCSQSNGSGASHSQYSLKYCWICRGSFVFVSASCRSTRDLPGLSSPEATSPSLSSSTSLFR